MNAAASRLLDRVHVLVVDENVGVRQRVQDIVVEHGGIVTATGTAERAAAFSSVIRPAVVVSDLRLGGGRSGVWLLDHLRAGPLARVPVIATSDSGDDEEIATALPFNAFMLKPVDEQELCALILGVVDQRGVSIARRALSLR